ncbi:Putative ATP-dependent helicase IRC3 [Hypoxylon texense]
MPLSDKVVWALSATAVGVTVAVAIGYDNNNDGNGNEDDGEVGGDDNDSEVDEGDHGDYGDDNYGNRRDVNLRIGLIFVIMCPSSQSGLGIICVMKEIELKNTTHPPDLVGVFAFWIYTGKIWDSLRASASILIMSNIRGKCEEDFLPRVIWRDDPEPRRPLGVAERKPEHSKTKSVLGDRLVYQWILDAKIETMSDEDAGVEQTAMLETPQLIFGLGA